MKEIVFNSSTEELRNADFNTCDKNRNRRLNVLPEALSKGIDSSRKLIGQFPRDQGSGPETPDSRTSH
ncbi:hypothetical protein EVAR_85080_1 [Eumeta japonica]|uniref:Uncharacterized protein n=1 Tax=Eumeta variegata TaxID=151549 RepID=A0A4C1XES3_EUMVA|nr:hypothetical protein EVAR_85080_1 [Eumeta japonica]